jgi:hypothetical protein
VKNANLEFRNVWSKIGNASISVANILAATLEGPCAPACKNTSNHLSTNFSKHRNERLLKAKILPTLRQEHERERYGRVANGRVVTEDRDCRPETVTVRETDSDERKVRIAELRHLRASISGGEYACARARL